jgi:gliding motility-associated-like protein
VYITDTLIEYVDVYVVDTLIEYITDTIIEYVDVIVDNYIYETDTLTIIETQLIDCETGEECIDPPGISECWPWTLYIPNTFSPNNDGINDTWQIIYDLECWVDVEFRIFNRWGEMIYHGYDFNFNSYPFWDGSINGGEYYAADGVYVYTFYGRREDSPEILEESGTISIFR